MKKYQSMYTKKEVLITYTLAILLDAYLIHIIILMMKARY
jgi:hypothetical protein